MIFSILKSKLFIILSKVILLLSKPNINLACCILVFGVNNKIKVYFIKLYEIIAKDIGISRNDNFLINFEKKLTNLIGIFKYSIAFFNLNFL